MVKRDDRTRVKYNLCVYVGLGTGECIPGWMPLVNKFIGIEPNPMEFLNIESKVHNSQWKDRVKLINAAASSDNAIHKFYLTPESVKSSLYKCNETVSEIYVKSINLCNFLQDNDWTHFLGKKDIDYIDLYISDTQGHDLEIIKTMEPFITTKRIGTIQAEAFNKNSEMYEGSKNHMNDWMAYSALVDNYKLVDTIREGEDQADLIFQPKPYDVIYK